MIFRNLTPHPLQLLDAAGAVMKLPVDGPAPQLVVCHEDLGTLAGLSIVASTTGAVTGLPEPEAETILIVSALVAEASYRDDLAYPGEAVRKSGKIVFAKGLCAGPGLARRLRERIRPRPSGLQAIWRATEWSTQAPSMVEEAAYVRLVERAEAERSSGRVQPLATVARHHVSLSNVKHVLYEAQAAGLDGESPTAEVSEKPITYAARGRLGWVPCRGTHRVGASCFGFSELQPKWFLTAAEIALASS